MAKFEISYAITRKNEGGWHGATGINIADRGGETFKGIARKMWSKWEGWKLVDEFKSKKGFPNNALNDPELSKLTHKFYKTNFWDKLKLDDVQNQHIANELFDTSVNIGETPGARMLQRSLNMLNRNQRSWDDLTVDGKVGPLTLRILNRLSHEDQRFCFNLLNILQGFHYTSIIERDRTQENFLRGWMERVELM